MASSKRAAEECVLSTQVSYLASCVRGRCFRVRERVQGPLYSHRKEKREKEREEMLSNGLRGLVGLQKGDTEQGEGRAFTSFLSHINGQCIGIEFRHPSAYHVQGFLSPAAR